MDYLTYCLPGERLELVRLNRLRVAEHLANVVWTYWFVVSQYVSIRPVLNQFNDWHVLDKWTFIFVTVSWQRLSDKDCDRNSWLTGTGIFNNMVECWFYCDWSDWKDRIILRLFVEILKVEKVGESQSCGDLRAALMTNSNLSPSLPLSLLPPPLPLSMFSLLVPIGYCRKGLVYFFSSLSWRYWVTKPSLPQPPPPMSCWGLGILKASPGKQVLNQQHSQILTVWGHGLTWPRWIGDK